MLEFSSSQLFSWLAGGFFPLCRIAALVGLAPLFGEAAIPPRVKVGLALLITIIVAPSVAVPANIEIVSWNGFALLIRQILVGAALGLSMQIAFAAIHYAGDLIGLQMGLGMAMLFDPFRSNESPEIGAFFGYIASLIFLALNGHLLLIAAITQSFAVVPIVSSHPLAFNWQSLINEGGYTFAMGLQLSLPIIATLLLTNIGLAIMTRSAPQLNIFSVGLPLTLLIGIIALFVTFPILSPMFAHVLMDTLSRPVF